MKVNKESIMKNRVLRNSFYYLRAVLFRNRLRSQAQKTAKLFGVQFSSEEKNGRIDDMVRMNKKYGYAFDEYFLFDFQNKTLEERLSFVPNWEKHGYACAMNDPLNDDLFDNKWKTYQKYKKFYHREVIYCNPEFPESEFIKFEERHPEYIIKPIDSSKGRGIHLAKRGENYTKILQENNGQFIAEELIHQTPELAKLHPASANTVRIPTINLGETVDIIHPFLRIGRNGNSVDNAGAGGIICCLDVESGCVLSASDEHGNRFEKHPETGESIIGFTVPKWEEAKETVIELAKVTPTNRYTGWDLALSDTGEWIMVEANRKGQFVWQIASQEGFRSEIDDYLQRLGTKY